MRIVPAYVYMRSFSNLAFRILSIDCSERSWSLQRSSRLLSGVASLVCPPTSSERRQASALDRKNSLVCEIWECVFFFSLVSKWMTGWSVSSSGSQCVLGVFVSPIHSSYLDQSSESCSLSRVVSMSSRVCVFRVAFSDIYWVFGARSLGKTRSVTECAIERDGRGECLVIVL